MFLILSIALLPLGVIAFVASLQSVRTTEVEKNALLRVALSLSARKLTSEIRAERAASQLTVDALARSPTDSAMCQQLHLFLHSNERQDGFFYIYDREGRKLCGSERAEPTGLAVSDRFRPGEAILLPKSGYLISRVFSRDLKVVALNYYSAAQLDTLIEPEVSLQNREMALRQGDQSLVVKSLDSTAGRKIRSMSSRIDPLNIILQMSVADTPATWSRVLYLSLPLLMWVACAAVGWFVVDRMLIQPLVQLRRNVASYRPGEPLPRFQSIGTPALEIRALGETFLEISEDVSRHESEMEESLKRQTKLTREVHHRVKNNLQIIASLINLHARSAKDAATTEAYASIQRRVDALSVVHRNHFAELEEDRGVGVRSLISELAASLRGTAPPAAKRFGIMIDSDNLHVNQDVAVPVAFLMTELVELAMLSAPTSSMMISVHLEPGTIDRAILRVCSDGLKESAIDKAHLHDRFDRVLTGLSRQLRAPLDHDGGIGEYRVAITVNV